MTYYYNFSKSYLEECIAEYKELLNIEKELDNLSGRNEFATNYNEYQQYMRQVQNYHYDDNIEYARIFANTKEELICVFRRHPDTDFGNIRTAYRNYPDSVSETSGHLVELTN